MLTNFGKLFLYFRGKTRILLVSESGTKSKSGNWLHFQPVDAQRVEDVDLAMDTN
jgi:hypothetical protein